MVDRGGGAEGLGALMRPVATPAMRVSRSPVRTPASRFLGLSMPPLSVRGEIYVMPGERSALSTYPATFRVMTAPASARRARRAEAGGGGGEDDVGGAASVVLPTIVGHFTVPEAAEAAADGVAALRASAATWQAAPSPRTFSPGGSDGAHSPAPPPGSTQAVAAVRVDALRASFEAAIGVQAAAAARRDRGFHAPPPAGLGGLGRPPPGRPPSRGDGGAAGEAENWNAAVTMATARAAVAHVPELRPLLALVLDTLLTAVYTGEPHAPPVTEAEEEDVGDGAHSEFDDSDSASAGEAHGGGGGDDGGIVIAPRGAPERGPPMVDLAASARSAGPGGGQEVVRGARGGGLRALSRFPLAGLVTAEALVPHETWRALAAKRGRQRNALRYEIDALETSRRAVQSTIDKSKKIVSDAASRYQRELMSQFFGKWRQVALTTKRQMKVRARDQPQSPRRGTSRCWLRARVCAGAGRFRRFRARCASSARLHTHTHKHTQTRIHTDTHTHTHTHTHARTHTHTHTHTRTHTHTHTHMYTTHARARACSA